MKTYLLIDGNAAMYRAYHALPPFKTSEGIPTNAIYGFLTMLQKAIVDFSATNIIVCFDLPKPTFRDKLYKEYRAQRAKTPDDLIAQMPAVREVLVAAGITYIEKEGFEADDLLAALVYKLKKEDAKVLILTGDRDLLQLVGDRVYMITPVKGISTIAIYDEDAVKEKFGVTPSQIPDYKALSGDASDNYHGARGIGPKTAAKLLQEYHTVENLLAHLDSVKEGKIKDLIATHKENVILSKQLATLTHDVPLDLDMAATEFIQFSPRLGEALDKLQMHSLKNRLFKLKAEAHKESTSTKVNPSEDEDQINLF